MLIHKTFFTKFVVLLGIFLFAFFLRAYQLPTAPPLFVDEASIGYNAFSLVETGKDEYGMNLPLSFTAFGDYKLPLYIYATVPAVSVFGLTTFAVRLVSILSGAGLTIVMYYFFRECKFSHTLAIIASLITAVSPWTVILGRFAWESNLALLLFTIGLLSAVRGLRTHMTKYYLLTSLFFALTWYTYVPYRMITLPMILVVMLLSYLYKKTMKNALLMILFFICLILPLIPVLFSSAGVARFNQTSIFTDPQTAVAVNESRTFCNDGAVSIACPILFNKVIDYAFSLLANTENIFSIHYLFVSGEDAKFLSVEKFGLFPLFLVPFYLLGFVSLIIYSRKRDTRKGVILFISCVLFALVPVLITRNPQRIQMSALYPFFLILIILGYKYWENFLKHKVFVSVILSICLVIFGFIYVYIYTNIHSRKFYDNERFIADVSRFIGEHHTDYDIVYINHFYSEPLIHYAFYNKIKPAYYQKNIKSGEKDATGFFHGVELGNVSVISEPYQYILCNTFKTKQKALYITNEDILKDKPAIGVKPLRSFTTDNGVHTVGYAYDSLSYLPNEQQLCQKSK